MLQQSLLSAMQHQQAGRLEEAEKLYRQILALHPNTPDALHLLGILCAQTGRNPEGIQLIRQAIAKRPEQPGFYANLGRALFTNRQFEESAAAYRQAVKLNPKDAESQRELGTSLKELGLLNEALACARDSLRLNPKSARGEYLLGTILLAQKDFNAAAQAYRRAAQLEPNSALAQIDVANVFRAMQWHEEAIAYYRQAIKIQPDFVDALFSLADLLLEAGRMEEAIPEYQKLIVLQPNKAETHNNLSVALRARRRFPEALAANEKALALRPDSALFWSNRGGLLRDLRRQPEAVTAIQRALQIDPNLFEAHLNIATNLLELAQVDLARQSAEKAVQLDPQSSSAHNVLANILKDDGQVEKSVDELNRAIEIDPDNAIFLSNKIYLLEFHPSFDERSLFAEARKWNDRFGLPAKKFIRPHENDRTPDRPLRIGYVSPGFCNHAESFFVIPLLENHDRAQFEIHCYSDSTRIDHITARIQAAAHVWHVSSAWNAQEFAEQIRRDRIDILIDLFMHMTQNRLLMFAQKPAPVQAAWLAYPGGTGLDAMDYRISDPWIDPPGTDESVYIERTLRLPKTWVCYDPLSEAAPAAPRSDGPFCFGSINNPCKINEPLLKLWSRVMQAVPDSRLLVLAFDAGHCHRITSLLESTGITPDRVGFLGRSLRTPYLRQYDQIDICLDPLPYNGITTTCDALWMGVPVITLAGQTAAGRATASILANVGLTEFIAHNPDQLIQIAKTLAADKPRLADLRQTLRDRFKSSPIMNAPGFAREMEAAYRQMWRNWCKPVQ